MKRVVILLLINLSCLFADNGWETINSEKFSYYLSSMDCYGENKFAACCSGTLALSEDGGLTWKEIYVGVETGLNSVIFQDSVNIWLVGQSGIIIKYNIAENKYYDKSIGGYQDLDKIIFYDNDNSLISNSLGTIYRTTNNGDYWDSVFSTDGYEVSSFAIKNNEIFMSSNKEKPADSKIYSSKDGGKSWDLITRIKNERVNVLSVYNDEIWAGGYFGLLMKSTDNGISWKWYNKKSNINIWSLIISEDSIYAASKWHSDGVLKSDKGNGKWTLDMKIQESWINTLISNGKYLLTSTSNRITTDEGKYEIKRKKIE